MNEWINASDRQWLANVWEKLSRKMEQECLRNREMIPYISENGRYVENKAKNDISWWTNGFWGGLMWQMFHATGKACYRDTAQWVEEQLDRALEQFDGIHHDVGFMWMLTSAASYRLFKNPDSLRRGLHAATLLAGRYNPAGKFLRSWNEDKAGWVIVDSMMNLPLLYWASEETEDPRFRYIAEAHAQTVAANTYRGDGSCHHIIVLNPENGELLEALGGQGYQKGSSWSRGQAWGLYGFALSYLHTGTVEYLKIAKSIAHYFITCVAGDGFISRVDFRSPSEPVKYDTTAAAIAASGLLQIAGLVDEEEKKLYTWAAVRMLKALDQRFCNWNPEEDAVVTHGTAAYHLDQGDFHKPIIYADYFYTEAVLRLLEEDCFLW